jgi:hypothetical protein
LPEAADVKEAGSAPQIKSRALSGRYFLVRPLSERYANHPGEALAIARLTTVMPGG